MARFTILLFALVADRFLPEPEDMWKTVPHPVALFGKAIDWLDAWMNRAADPAQTRQAMGMAALAVLLVVALVIGNAAGVLFGVLGIVGFIAELAVVVIFLAQKSLADHVAAVETGLRGGGLDGGRRAVSQIVGRDPSTLDESGVSRAAIESLAENASDGVVAPAFWYLLLGLPGILAYKALNTADSMIGHRTERHADFGWASARLDDLANWMPARGTGLLIVAADWTMRGQAAARATFETMKRDARLHRSPNAGWPESAMAAALGIALGGPRVYAGDRADEPFMNAGGRRTAGPDDIGRALGIFWRSMTVLAILVAAVALLL